MLHKGHILVYILLQIKWFTLDHAQTYLISEIFTVYFITYEIILSKSIEISLQESRFCKIN